MDMMSADISKLAEALSKMQGAISGVRKDKVAKAGSYSYKYADLADVWDAVRKPLSENGLSVSQTYSENDNHILLVTLLMHSSGQWIKSSLKIVTNGLKIQQIGSEMTYNRRYALSAILGIAADDDDDGSLANEKAREKKSAPKEEDEFISAQEAHEIENLIDPMDVQYRSDLLAFFSNLMKVPLISDFSKLRRKHLQACMNSVNRRRSESSLKKPIDEEIPF